MRTLATLALLLAPSSRSTAQSMPRPWQDWRTAQTEHFSFHYPAQYREWTLALAQRMEGIRSQVTHIVGFAPDARVNVVVDDPTNEANGAAFSALDAPTIVLYPTPPDPRSEIGNFNVWEELLATHEFAHLAHMNRPSRNKWTRLLYQLSPVPLSPITTRAPRWALEGYATFVEGRITRSGRPNHAWRAAIIRQFAIEGRMPSYEQLAASATWQSGSFAYLVGSAYIEWLARREGDSSVVAVWRRMTAVTDRSFNQAFAGVYGGSPAELYGRFSAEVTGQALALDRALRREGLVEGTLVQRLQRSTGDPAVSFDGRYVALTVRRQDAPSQLVVWRTAEEPDTSAARRRAQQLARDPLDVPDRAFYPAPRKAVVSLLASDGAPYETPRWLADGRRLLVSRRVTFDDGSVRPDLFLWNAETGDVQRVTRNAALRDADPSPDGGWAAAARCERGWCDLVRVDLGSGAVQLLRAGSVTRNYYRPRVSRRTGEIVVAEQSGDRWRIARVSPVDGTLHYADPDDGITRYDATWGLDGRTIYATSEATGIANLERIDTDARVERLTSVTGAAVATDVAPDGSLWYLSLQGAGYDLRRLRVDTAVHIPLLPMATAVVDSLSPVLPPRTVHVSFDTAARPALAAAPAEDSYGYGPTRWRALPAATSGFGGTSTQLALVRSDPVGRLGFSLMGAAGTGALPEGGALRLISRFNLWSVGLEGWISHEAPSRELPNAGIAGLDLSRSGGALRFDRLHFADGGDFGVTLAALAERQHATGFTESARRAGVLGLTVARRQRDEDQRYDEQLVAIGEAGANEEGAYLRQRSELRLGTASKAHPLTTLSLAYGTIGGGSGSTREAFVIGGFASPLIDPLLDARRVDAPAYPTGSLTGATFSSLRAALPVSSELVPSAALELFYAGASTDMFHTALRSYGLELRQRVPAIAALGTPEVEALTGVARAVDEPVKGAWRYYVTLALRP